MIFFLKTLFPAIYFLLLLFSLGWIAKKYSFEHSDLSWLNFWIVFLNSFSSLMYLFMCVSPTPSQAFRFLMFALTAYIAMFVALMSLVYKLSMYFIDTVVVKKRFVFNSQLYLSGQCLVIMQAALLLLLQYLLPPIYLVMKPVVCILDKMYIRYAWQTQNIYAPVVTIMNLLAIDLLYYTVSHIQKATTKHENDRFKILYNLGLLLSNIVIVVFDIVLPFLNIFIMPPIMPIAVAIIVMIIIRLITHLPIASIMPQIFAMKIFDLLEYAIVFVDDDLNIIYANKYFSTLFEKKNTKNQNIAEFLPDDFDFQNIVDGYQTLLQVNTTKKKYINLKYNVQNDIFGQALGGVFLLADFTELTVDAMNLTFEYKNINKKIAEKNYQLLKQNKRLRDQLNHRDFLQKEYMHLLKSDDLTQVYNRDYFFKLVTEKIEAGDKGFSVFSIDINNFKYINDLRGHWLGDLVLVKIAETLKDIVAADGIVARTDGDNFLLLHNNIANENDAEIFGRILLNLVSEIKSIDNFEVSVSVSIGACIYQNGMSTEDVINNAQLANLQANLHQDKKYILFTPKISEEITTRFRLIIEIKQSCEENRFIPYYQPQVLVTKDGLQKIVGYESLARWHHPTRGILTPFFFIPVAESSGTVIPISYSILRQSCYAINDLMVRGFTDFTVSVNLSAKQLNSETFLQVVTDIFAETKVDTTHLEFEITETELLVYNERILSKCLELKKMGIRISIDDFGVAFASFNYIKNLPIDKMKIDKSFVDKIGKDKRAEEILYIVLEFAKICNLKVVVEGVEKKYQLDFLLKQNDNIIIQGYYFFKPSPYERIVNENIFPQQILTGV